MEDAAWVPVGRLEAVRFSLAGGDPEGVGTPEIVSADSARGSAPMPGGVNDPAMGVTESGARCTTCDGDRATCLGHRGTIVLNSPIIDPQHSDRVKRWLKILCHKCSALVVPPNQRPTAVKGRPKARMTRVMAMAPRFKTCWRCDGPTDWTIKGTDHDYVTVMRQRPGVDPEELPPAVIHDILGGMGDDDAEYMRVLGDTHPSRLVLTELPVLPVPMRPGSMKGDGRMSQDDLTTLYQFVLQYNSAVVPQPDALRNPSATQSQNVRYLATAVHELVRGGPDANRQGHAARPGEKPKLSLVGAQPGNPIVPMAKRIGGKMGLLRGLLEAHRTWGMARAVIANDPQVPIGSIKIPMFMAQTLQVEEVVNPSTYARLAKLLANGRTYPGCTQVIRDGRAYLVESLPPEFVLVAGDVVLRDLQDGDPVMFNRPPSLEWSSITRMSVIVDTRPGTYVILMNVNACVLFNADFDGDQMAIFAVRDMRSRAEITVLSGVDKMFIGWREGDPVIGGTYDTLVALPLLCSEPAFDRWHAMAVLAGVSESPALPPGDRFTGRDLASCVLRRWPVDIVAKTGAAKSYLQAFVPQPELEKELVIRQGTMTSGVLDKAVSGGGASNGLYRRIADIHGNSAAVEAVDAMSKLGSSFLRMRGMTVTAGDLFLNPGARRQLAEVVQRVRAEADALTAELEAGAVVPPVGLTTVEFYERQLKDEVMNTRSEVLDIVLRALGGDNHFIKLMATGAKGKPDNITGIFGHLGLVTVNNQLLPFQFSIGRTFPWDQRFSYDAQRGFVANSVSSGLTVGELWLAAAMARFNLIGKALLTSVAGQQYQETVKNCEGAVTDAFGRVVNVGRLVLRFLYGNTGFDPRQLVDASLSPFYASDAEFAKLSAVPSADGRHGDKQRGDKQLAAAATEYHRELVEARDEFRAAVSRAERAAPDLSAAENARLPINVRMEFMSAVHRLPKPARPSPAELVRMISAVREFARKLPLIYTNPHLNPEDLPETLRAGMRMLRWHLLASLAPANLARATPELLEHVLQTVRARTFRCLLGGGVAVGIIAAQVFGQPFTQFMLNSIHNVGGGTNRDLAKQLKALLRATATYDLPMTVMPREGLAAGTLAARLELTDVMRITRRWQLFAEHFGEATHPLYAAENAEVAEFVRTHPAQPPPPDLLPICIRLEVSRVTMMLRDVRMGEVARAITAAHPNLYVVYRSELAPVAKGRSTAVGDPAGAFDEMVVLRVYARASMFSASVISEKLASDLIKKVLHVQIRGVSRIRSTSVITSSHLHVDEAGAFVPQSREVVQTDASNFREILLHPDVDALATISSSITDVLEIFGPQAARRVLEESIVSSVNAQGYHEAHVQLYADLIFSSSEPVSLISGIGKRSPNAVLLAACQRSAYTHFAAAAASGTVDPLLDPTAASMVGAKPQLGSGFARVAIDSDFVRDHAPHVGSVFDALDAIVGGCTSKKKKRR